MTCDRKPTVSVVACPRCRYRNRPVRIGVGIGAVAIGAGVGGFLLADGSRLVYPCYRKGTIRGRRASRSGVGVGVGFGVAGGAPGVAVCLPRSGVGVPIGGP